MKKFQLSILSEVQMAMWPILAKVSKRFVLYGGTAIALRRAGNLRSAKQRNLDFEVFILLSGWECYDITLGA